MLSPLLHKLKLVLLLPRSMVTFCCDVHMLGLFTLSVPPHPPISLMKKFQGLGRLFQTTGRGGVHSLPGRGVEVASTLYLQSQANGYKKQPLYIYGFYLGSKNWVPRYIRYLPSPVQPPVPPTQTLLRNR